MAKTEVNMRCVKACPGFMGRFVLAIFACCAVSLSLSAEDDGFRFEWSRARIDGTRTGCVTPLADDIGKSVGTVSGSEYHAPNGRIFKGGTVADVVSVVLAAQPAMAPVKKAIGRSSGPMILAEPECALSNLFIDTIMAAVEKRSGRHVDVGIGNFGGIRVDMPGGDILLDDILSMFPFSNTIVYVALKGRDLRALLEQMAATRVQVLGGVRIVVSDGRLVSATIGGEPLDDDRVYGVATISFLLDGGDNLHVGRNALEIINYDDINIIDIMLEYIHAETAAGREISYSTDGRVKIME